MKNVKKRDATIIMGDFNAKIGKGAEDKLVGLYGLDRETEEMIDWFNFAERKN